MNRYSDVFTYDPETGVLRWKVDRWRAKAGQVAGCHCRYGYLVVRVFRRTTKVHRIAWELHFGEPAPAVIDHVNGVRDDNRIVNLRACTHSQNLANKAHRTDRSLLPGVKRAHKGPGYTATVSCNRRAYYLGTYETQEAAHAAYVTKRRELFGEFVRDTVRPA